MLKGHLIKVAIVDDDEDDYFIIADYIKSIEGAHFLTEWINNYHLALDKIREGAFNIYFIDYRLGNETGVTLLQEAMAAGCEQPIVLLTGKGNRAIDIQAMHSGATDYLAKSELNTEKLERCIRYSLERAATLKELKERENRYRNLFANSKDAVLITDTLLNITEANHAATLLFNLSYDELVNKNLYNFITGEDQKEAIRSYLGKGRSLTDMRIEISDLHKEIKPCLLSVTQQKTSGGGWLIHAILHDITNFKRAEMANLQAQKLAANERLMRIIAHEIRNPLNNINLSMEHLESGEDDPAMKTELMNIIRRNCKRINQSIAELLDVTRTEELEFKKYTLQEIMDESLVFVSDRLNLQNISLKKSYPDTPLLISADKPKLKIAFSNILINAIEAMEENKRKSELVVLLQESRDAFTVFIQDNGIGINEENLPKLFEPFFTLKRNGMGLGLATSYSILQSHKASVQVESKVSKGTSFIIHFAGNNQPYAY